MRIKEKIKQEPGKWRQIGWRGILIGFILSLVFGPAISTALTPHLVSTGLYSSPQFDTSVKKVDSVYSPGDRAGKFGNITWEEGYGVYRVRFTHAGGPLVDRAVFEVRFPGCLVQSSGTGQGNGAITVNNPLETEIYTPNRTDAEVLGCTIQISTESITPDEGYRLEFVVDHTPERCDLLTAYNPIESYFVEYHWSKNGASMTDRVIGQIEGADEEFQDIRLPSNSTKMTQKEDYSAFIVGAGNGSSERALQRCFR